MIDNEESEISPVMSRPHGNLRPTKRKSPGVVSLPAVALNLRAARGRSGLTQTQLAKAAGTSVRAVGRIEQGETAHPGTIILGKFAAALDTTIEALDSTLHWCPTCEKMTEELPVEDNVVCRICGGSHD